jgi:hypothetical protein
VEICKNAQKKCGLLSVKELFPKIHQTMMDQSEPVEIERGSFIHGRLFSDYPFTGGTLNVSDVRQRSHGSLLAWHVDGKDDPKGIAVTQSFAWPDPSHVLGGRLVVKTTKPSTTPQPEFEMKVPVGWQVLATLHNLEHCVEPGSIDTSKMPTIDHLEENQEEWTVGRGSIIIQQYSGVIQALAALRNKAASLRVSCVHTQEEKERHAREHLIPPMPKELEKAKLAGELEWLYKSNEIYAKSKKYLKENTSRGMIRNTTQLSDSETDNNSEHGDQFSNCITIRNGRMMMMKVTIPKLTRMTLRMTFPVLTITPSRH